MTGVIAAALLVAGPAPEALQQQVLTEVEGLRTLTQQMVDQIYSYSELGFQEVETSRYVTGILEKSGFRIERGVAGLPTAWVATWGSGKPVIGFIADIDCLPGQSQRPGVAYHDPIVAGAPGHGEGHNAGQAVNVAAALALQKIMRAHKIAGTLKLYPGVAEELLGAKTFYVRSGLLAGVDVMLGAHVDNQFGTSYGPKNLGMISVQYAFHGQTAHAASFPWKGKSALDAVELMDVGWNFRREHLPVEQRSHYVIIDGGQQPNVVPSEAAVWYFFRHTTADGVRELHQIGDAMAQGATLMTGTTVTQRTVGSAWPLHFNKVVAEVQQRAIERVGVPEWSEADQTLARALQKEIGAKVTGLKTRVKKLDEADNMGGSDDIGDISWVMPTVYLRYPSNIPELPGHNWANGVSMATPIGHKGASAGAKAQALTALDLLLSPDLVKQAWAYLGEQTRETRYTPLIAPSDRPAIELNRDKMERFRPELRKHYYDPGRYRTYLEQLGIKYPTVRSGASHAEAR